MKFFYKLVQLLNPKTEQIEKICVFIFASIVV